MNCVGFFLKLQVITIYGIMVIVETIQFHFLVKQTLCMFTQKQVPLCISDLREILGK